MKPWREAEAKEKLDLMISQARKQPQKIIKNGRVVAYIVSMAEWKRVDPKPIAARKSSRGATYR